MPPPSANHMKNRPYINRFSCVCWPYPICYTYACTLPIHNTIIIMVAANYDNINCIRTRRDIAGVIIITIIVRTTDRFSGPSTVPGHFVLPHVTPPSQQPRRSKIVYTIFDGFNANIFSPVFGFWRYILKQ